MNQKESEISQLKPSEKMNVETNYNRFERSDNLIFDEPVHKAQEQTHLPFYIDSTIPRDRLTNEHMNILQDRLVPDTSFQLSTPIGVSSATSGLSVNARPVPPDNMQQQFQTLHDYFPRTSITPAQTFHNQPLQTSIVTSAPNEAPQTDSQRSAEDGNKSTSSNASLTCKICGKVYSRRDNLAAHQRVHTGEKPYKCTRCGKRFRWQSALRNHEGAHMRRGSQPVKRGRLEKKARNLIHKTTTKELSSLSHLIDISQPLPTMNHHPLDTDKRFHLPEPWNGNIVAPDNLKRSTTLNSYNEETNNITNSSFKKEDDNPNPHNFRDLSHFLEQNEIPKIRR